MAHAPRSRVIAVRFVPEDGDVTTLAVGETVDWHLRFSSADNDTLASVTVNALAMPPRAARAAPTKRYEDGELRWPTTLRGDGWSAYWAAPRPAIGPIEVTGEFENDISAGIYGHDFEPATRGRVRRIRVRVRLEPATPHNDAQAPSGVAGTHRWIDLQTAPDMGYVPAQPLQIDAHTQGMPEALVVDLDLDAAAQAAPRSRFCPADSVAHGRSMWTADTDLPIVARVDLTDPPAVTEYILPLPVKLRAPWSPRGRLRLFPDTSGCWVIGDGSLFRLSQDGGFAFSKALPDGSLAAASDGMTLLVHGAESFVLHGDGSLTAIELPPGSGRDLLHPVVDSQGEYLALLRDSASETVPIGYYFRPARIFADGTALTGPVMDLGTDPEAIGLVDGAYWLVTRRNIHILDSALLPEVVRPLPPSAMVAGFVNDQMWIITHRPHPLDDPDWRNDLDISPVAPGFNDSYLLVMLDLPNLRPLWAMPINEHHPRVSKGDLGTIWVTTHGIRGRYPDGTTTDLDVSTLLEKADQQRRLGRR